MQLYLTVRPEDTRTASAYPAGLAHAAYRIGEGSSLLSRNLLTPARSGPMAPLPKGLLGLGLARSAPSIDRPAALAEAVLRECARRSYSSGIVLDFDEPVPRRIAAALLPYWGGGAPEKPEVLLPSLRPTPRLAEHPTVICEHSHLRRQL